ncbi:carboxyltransferase domain-containing protein [Arthrobacter sp. PsM3]|uniref:carboxyltransferase domain-containing protein n=1 Tax=Arthrobacter sp. PsM3 TaxID=3030531 RepID=UPI00263F6CFB|nr:carboxyltransferase domain-containing protein [Arthrobacter sp. PsM3]
MARSLNSLPLDGNIFLFSPTFTVVNVGSTAVRAIVSGADKMAVHKRVHALSRELSAWDVPGLGRLVPTNDSLLVEFDPSLVEAPTLKRLVRLIDASASGTEDG